MMLLVQVTILFLHQIHAHNSFYLYMQQLNHLCFQSVTFIYAIYTMDFHIHKLITQYPADTVSEQVHMIEHIAAGHTFNCLALFEIIIHCFVHKAFAASARGSSRTLLK